MQHFLLTIKCEQETAPLFLFHLYPARPTRYNAWVSSVIKESFTFKEMDKQILREKGRGKKKRIVNLRKLSDFSRVARSQFLQNLSFPSRLVLWQAHPAEAWVRWCEERGKCQNTALSAGKVSKNLSLRHLLSSKCRNFTLTNSIAKLCLMARRTVSQTQASTMTRQVCWLKGYRKFES